MDAEEARVDQFSWPVLVDGYAWVRSAGGPWLVGRPWATHEARISMSPGLFRDFAELAHSQKAIHAFATFHGMLGEPDGEVRDPRASGSAKTPAESLNFWRTQISRMARAVDIWDAVSRGDDQALRSWIVLEDRLTSLARDRRGLLKGGSRLLIDDAHSPRAARSIATQKRARTKRLIAARLFLERIVNQELRQRVDYQMMVDESQLFHRWPAPRSLIGALWVQLAEAVIEGAENRQCIVCGRSMLITTAISGGRRRQSLYCGNACKQRRARTKLRARLMLAEGASRPTVARKLDIHEAELTEMGL